MANFPSINPNYGLAKSSSPRVLEVRYGDGYSSRLVFGLNQDLKMYQPRWDNLSESDADTIEDFLVARKGQESFSWTPPGDSAGKYICRNWNKTIPYANRASISATFQQVAEP
jgi:phage-related protein